MTKQKRIKHPSFLLGCALVLLACLLLYLMGAEKPALIKSMDDLSMDIMFAIRGPESDSGNVVIVDIDERSLKQIGQWPWPRNILAKLTKTLINSGVKAVGFDIIFAEKDRTSPSFFFSNRRHNLTEKNT